MKTFKLKPLSLAIGLLFITPALLAQQATDVGNITVEGRPGGGDTGLITQEDSPRARSSVTRPHLDKITPSAGVFQTIEMLPGVNSFSQDATGLFGGGIRVRGFAGDQMGLTINGAPVNDSGNFAVFPQEYADSENLCEVFVTQGSTDSDAPHVGASGGNIGMVTCAPTDKHGFHFAQSFGDLNFRRTFMRVNTGLIGESGLKAFVSYSKSKVDKFKGPGGADRDHVDVGVEMRPNSDVFLSTSLLYNRAITNNIRQLTLPQINALGRGVDLGSAVPQHLTPVNGTAQLETAPADGYYQFNINPFKNYLWTGKAEWKASKALTLSAEPYYWYAYGTGGGQLQTLQESSSTTTLGGGVRDINGDGDVLDKVMVYGSSLTETNRPGITLKANYQLDNHNLNAGYWMESAKHRQTGPRVTFDNAGNPASQWLDASGAYLLRQDGAAYQARDWLTVSNARSLFLQDKFATMQDKLQLQLGLRYSEIERTFTNYANSGSTAVAGRSDGDYEIKRTYGKLLPNLGAKYNFDQAQSAFVNVAQNFRAPSNFVLSNLLKNGTVVNGVLTGATLGAPVVDMETSINTDIGYRYQTEKTTFSASLFYVDFKNRIARSFESSTQTVTDFNVGDSTMKGFEMESGHKLNGNFSFYGSLSYTESEMKNNLQNAALPAAAEQTAGRQLPDTPKWMAGASVNYNNGPWFSSLKVKHTGESFSTLVNDEAMPSYTLVNLMAGYRLPGGTFFKNPEIRFNVDNIFNTEYQRINSPSGSSFTVRAQGVGGSSPAYYVGAPRFASLTLRSDF